MFNANTSISLDTNAIIKKNVSIYVRFLCLYV